MKFFDINSAAKLIGCTSRRVTQLCTQGKLPGAVKKNSRWSIPATAHVKLSRESFPVGREVPQEFYFLPKPRQDEAIRRLGLIARFERFSGQHVRGGGLRTEAINVFCYQENISISTFKRWIRKNRKEGVMGLVDRRGENPSFKEIISPEAFEFFKQLYLDPKQPSLRQCWKMLRHINNFEKRGWIVPSYASMCRYADKNIPLPAMIFHREGEQAYNSKCSPYIVTDYESIEPGSVWVGDHHQCNLFVLHRGDWVRPWVTAWLDMRSRAVVGWHISLSPNQTTILLAFKNGVLVYGPPELVKIDNGKDYDSELFTGTTKQKRLALKKGYLDEQTLSGLYALLGIETSFSIPYHPQSKNIERWFDTLDMQFSKSFETYCGKDTARKPDGLIDYLKTDKAVREAVDLKVFSEKFGKYIEIYNNTIHGGRGMNGQTPMQVLSSRSSKRVLRAESLDLLLRVWSSPVTVGKNGVRFKNLWYGQFDAGLMQHQGRAVRLSYDPADVRTVRVFDAESWQYVATVSQARLIQYHSPVAEENLREAMRQKSRIRKLTKNYKTSQRAANMSLPDLALEAMNDSTEKPPKKRAGKTLKPVSTVLDGQEETIRRTENQIKLKKAVGAENSTDFLRLDLDLIRKPKVQLPSIELHLFGE